MNQAPTGTASFSFAAEEGTPSLLEIGPQRLGPLSHPLTPTQARADALVSSFVDHATDGYSLAAMVGGGLVYRLGRAGTLALGSRFLAPEASVLTSSLLRYGSVGIGFTGEVFTFEAGQRALKVGIGGADPNLLRWSGENGLGRGLVGAAITLGSLKGTDTFVNGRNPVLQHLFQDSAMVLAHNVSGSIGITERPRESLAEQMVNAEATLWQMNAGMALVHGAFPRLGQVERSLDLSIRSRNVGALRACPPAVEREAPRQFNEPLLAPAGSQSLPDHIMAMSAKDEKGEGASGGGRPRMGSISEASIPDVSQVREIQTHLPRILSGEAPTVRFTGGPWNPARDAAQVVAWLEGPHPLPRGKTLSVLVEAQGIKVVFYWGEGQRDRGRVWWRTDGISPRASLPSIPEERPSSLLPPPPPGASSSSRERVSPGQAQVPAKAPAAPAVPQPIGAIALVRRPAAELRPEDDSSETLDDLYTAFRRVLDPAALQRVRTPALRLIHGRLGEPELLGFAEILSALPLPEGHKVMIYWMERGGGLLSFWRQGDRLRATLRGFRIPEQEFFLFPEDPHTGKLWVHRPGDLRTFSFESLEEYERRSDAELRELALLAGLPRDEKGGPREEGSALRGITLARVAAQISRPAMRREVNLPPADLEKIRRIHLLLERAYTFLDLGVLSKFGEWLGRERLLVYQLLVEGINRQAEGSGRTLLVPFDQMVLDLPGRYVVSERGHLRWALLAQLFSSPREERFPAETRVLLTDAPRLGRIYGKMLRSYLNALEANFTEIRSLTREVSLERILQADPSTLTPYVRRLREEILIRLQDLREYARGLRGNPGVFHREMLRQAFEANPTLRDLYGRVQVQIQVLPPPLRANSDLPTLFQLEALIGPVRP